MYKKQGKLVVIEGIDGSGKSTQIDLIVENLKRHGISFEVISFPRYEDNIYVQLIGRYLEGEFGQISEVNPYLLALAFAGDRALAKSNIEAWLAEGKIVIANRYVSANKAHLGANLPEEKREEFLRWLDELEYKTNGMPKEDLTILLDVDPRIGQKNVFDRQKPDLHEGNLNHLEEARNLYLSLAKKEANWYVIDCVKNSSMKSKEEIHQEIGHILQDQL